MYTIRFENGPLSEHIIATTQQTNEKGYLLMTSRCACTIYIQKIYPVCTPLAQMANSYVSRLNLFSLSRLKKLMLDYKDFTVLYAIKWLIVTGHGELANNYSYDVSIIHYNHPKFAYVDRSSAGSHGHCLENWRPLQNISAPLSCRFFF